MALCLHAFNLLVILFCCVKPVMTQTAPLTTGTEFVFSIINSYSDGPIQMYVLVSNQNAVNNTTVQIYSPFVGFTKITRVVRNMTIERITIGPESIQVQNRASVSNGTISCQRMESKGIYLYTSNNVKVMVYVHIENSNGLSGDTYQVFPLQPADAKYRAVTTTRPYSSDTITSANIIAITAYDDGTTVTVDGKGYSLDSLETLSIISTLGLSGTEITSTNKIAVVTGCTIGTTVNNNDANYETIMLLPEDTWSKKFIAVPFNNMQANTFQSTGTYQAIAGGNVAVITYPIDPQSTKTITLQPGKYVLFNASAGVISSTAPIQLIQIGQPTSANYSSAFFIRAPRTDMTKESLLVQATGDFSCNNGEIHHYLRLYVEDKSRGKITFKSNNDVHTPPTRHYTQVARTKYHTYEAEINADDTYHIYSNNAAFAASVYSYKKYNGCGYLPVKADKIGDKIIRPAASEPLWMKIEKRLQQQQVPKQEVLSKLPSHP
jgi:hypothetical protein